jgi:hypothetical protein
MFQLKKTIILGKERSKPRGKDNTLVIKAYGVVKTTFSVLVSPLNFVNNLRNKAKEIYIYIYN